MGESSAREGSSDAAAAVAFTKHAKRRERTYPAPAPLRPLFDTHAHLTCFWSKDPVGVLVRAALAGVRSLVTLYDPLGDRIDLPTFQGSLEAWTASARSGLSGGGVASPLGDDPCVLADHVRYLVGAHPYGAPDYTDATHAVLERALGDPRCAGIGEIGLDYHFDADDDIEAAPHDVQMAVMARQLELACERDVPVELHLRNDDGDDARTAHGDALRVLTEVGVPRAGCILHCFGEDRPTMERFVELGCHIAFGGAATFKRNGHIREAFAACPRDRILFETDCPYMAPEPIRGLECEPAMIAFTADCLCRDRAGRTGERAEDIAAAAWENARAIFFTRGTMGA